MNNPLALNTIEIKGTHYPIKFAKVAVDYMAKELEINTIYELMTFAQSLSIEHAGVLIYAGILNGALISKNTLDIELKDVNEHLELDFQAVGKSFQYFAFDMNPEAAEAELETVDNGKEVLTSDINEENAVTQEAGNG